MSFEPLYEQKRLRLLHRTFREASDCRLDHFFDFRASLLLRCVVLQLLLLTKNLF
jgi:hypothetical protein